MTIRVIKNIGTLITGDVNNPFSDATTILIKEGLIEKIGDDRILENLSGVEVIDAAGTTVAPGLIDSHGHPVLGDYSPRQKITGFIESSLHGGVTRMISAGEAHTPGRPKDPAGVKALAILAHKCSQNLRPGGVKLHGGALILEKGLKEDDLAECAAEGVWLIGEVGLGSIKEPAEAAPLVACAKKLGMKVMMHTGGTSIPGSSTVTAEDVILVNPDVVSHLNGGPTAVAPDQIRKLINDTDMILEIVQCGNPKAMKLILEILAERKEFHRVIMGNDAPSGSGSLSLGILRTIALAASVAGVPAEIAICMATGNTARAYGLHAGFIKEGFEADLVIMDAPLGSSGKDCLGALEAGDLPGISMVIIDGVVMVNKSLNTPPPVTAALRVS